MSECFFPNTFSGWKGHERVGSFFSLKVIVNRLAFV